MSSPIPTTLYHLNDISYSFIDEQSGDHQVVTPTEAGMFRIVDSVHARMPMQDKRGVSGGNRRAPQAVFASSALRSKQAMRKSVVITSPKVK
jgi:hypothetical protein